MIRTKRDLQEYVAADAKANGRSSVKPRLMGDEIWKFILTLRKLEYHTNRTGVCKYLSLPFRVFYRMRLHKRALLLGYTIPINVCNQGLALVHRGTIVIANSAKIGRNCRIHEGVTIGATNGSNQAAVIGDNVFLASGAKIIGAITVADDVAIAANAVVTRSIPEKGTTWGGVPAQKISDNDSHSNLSTALFQ